jgi:hypothetical protein
VSARRRRSSASSPADQLPLEAPPAPPQRSHDRADVDQVAKAAVARRAKPSAIPGRVKLTFTLDLSRELAERLSARAIREAKNLEGVIADILEETMQ